MTRRRAIGLAVAVVVALLAVFAFVPTPGARTERCRDGEFRHAPCIAVTGRAVYVERDDPDGDRDTHVVLTATESTTWPAVSVLKIPPDMAAEERLGFGRWVSAIGYEYEGEHGRTVLYVMRLAVR